MKYFAIAAFACFLMLSACHRRTIPVLTLQLKHTDYIESIESDGTVQAVNNSIVVAPRVWSDMKVSHLAKEGTYVKKGDTVCILEAGELMINLEKFKTDLEKIKTSKDSLVATQAMQLSVLEAQVETNKAQMEISMLDSIQLKFAPEVRKKLINLEMEKVKIEKMKLEKKLAAQKKITASEIAQFTARIAMQENQVQRFQDQANSLYLKAPVDGLVIRAEMPEWVTNLGYKVEEGNTVYNPMPIFQIPDMSKMQVSVEVLEADYKRINTDQKVEIKIPSIVGLKTTGKVVRKSLATKNKDQKSAVKSYEVIVSIDSCDSKMSPGLGASCSIIINNVKDTIVVPSAAVFTRDSLKIVYVAQDHKFMPVQIESGLSNSSESIISKGLKGNESIALVEPPYFLILREAKKENKVIEKPVPAKRDSLEKESPDKIVLLN
jgi:multidrug efflux pump subunit AcrA (membrane-fusion protein)